MQTAVSPRGLRRRQAAAYLGISAAAFDRARKTGVIPPPVMLAGCKIWLREQLDLALDGIADKDHQATSWVGVE